MKAKQIAILPETETERSSVMALSEDGSIFILTPHKLASGSANWFRLPDLPEPK